MGGGRGGSINPGMAPFVSTAPAPFVSTPPAPGVHSSRQEVEYVDNDSALAVVGLEESDPALVEPRRLTFLSTQAAFCRGDPDPPLTPLQPLKATGSCLEGRVGGLRYVRGRCCMGGRDSKLSPSLTAGEVCGLDGALSLGAAIQWGVMLGSGGKKFSISLVDEQGTGSLSSSNSSGSGSLSPHQHCIASDDVPDVLQPRGPGGGATGTAALQPADSEEIAQPSAAWGWLGNELAAGLLTGSAGPGLPTRSAASEDLAACAGAAAGAAGSAVADDTVAGLAGSATADDDTAGVAGSVAADGAAADSASDAASRGPASEVPADMLISAGPEVTLATSGFPLSISLGLALATAPLESKSSDVDHADCAAAA